LSDFEQYGEERAIAGKWTALSLDYGEGMPEHLKREMFFELNIGRGKSEEDYRKWATRQ